MTRQARLPSSGGIAPLNWFSNGENSECRLASFPSSGGIAPLSALPERFSTSQAGKIAELARDRPAELVAIEVHPLQVGQVAKLGAGIAPLNSLSWRSQLRFRLTSRFPAPAESIR